MKTKKKTHTATGQTFGQGIIMEIKIRNNRSASVGNSLWKGIGTYLSKLGQYNKCIYYCITQERTQDL